MSTIEVTPGEPERIAALLAIADADAAGELLRIAETTNSKESRKAARRALYLLSQKHITPSAPIGRSAPVPVSHFRKEPTPFVAYASSVDGAGNSTVSIVVTDPDSGSPLLYQVLLNDEVGIRDYFIERISRRALQAHAEMLFAQLDDGIAFAEIEVDYAIQQIRDTREINRSLGTQSPSGFLDVVEALGEPKETTSVSAVHDKLYTVFSKEDLLSDISFSASPEAFFDLLWFHSWFLPAELMLPWINATDEGEFGEIVGKGDRNSALKRMVATASSVLMDQELCDRYVYRLEASADILSRRGRTMEARFALYHALNLREKGSESHFATTLIGRTAIAALEMLMLEQQGPVPDLLDILDPAVLSELTPEMRQLFEATLLEEADPDVIGIIHPTDSAPEPR